MFLEGEAEQVSEFESILVVCVDEEVGVVDASGRIFDDCVRSGGVQTHPVREGVCPDVCAEKVLAVDCGGDIE
jgi:hypothetical protein